MATVPEPSYITAAEVKDQSSLTGINALSDDQLDDLIQRAEDMIDAYVGRQPHHPDDNNIDRVFPRVNDLDVNGNAEIPYRVSRATLAQVEWLYINWWSTKETASTPVEHEVTSLRIGGDGSYGEERAGGGVDFSAATLCPQAKALLNGFRSRFVGTATVDPDLVPTAL